MPPRFPDLDRALTTVEGAQAVGVSVHCVRKWRTRGWRAPDGTQRQLPVLPSADGKPRHRYRDLIEAERDTHVSNHSHRRVGPPERIDWAVLNLTKAS